MDLESSYSPQGSPRQGHTPQSLDSVYSVTPGRSSSYLLPPHTSFSLEHYYSILKIILSTYLFPCSLSIFPLEGQVHEGMSVSCPSPHQCRTQRLAFRHQKHRATEPLVFDKFRWAHSFFVWKLLNHSGSCYKH